MNWSVPSGKPVAATKVALPLETAHARAARLQRQQSPVTAAVRCMQALCTDLLPTGNAFTQAVSLAVERPFAALYSLRMAALRPIRDTRARGEDGLDPAALEAPGLIQTRQLMDRSPKRVRPSDVNTCRDYQPIIYEARTGARTAVAGGGRAAGQGSDRGGSPRGLCRAR